MRIKLITEITLTRLLFRGNTFMTMRDMRVTMSVIMSISMAMRVPVIGMA